VKFDLTFSSWPVTSRLTFFAPPRSIFLNFPMGNPFGRPHDRDMQREILVHALKHAVAAKEPGELIDLPYEWGERVLTIMELQSGWSAKPPDPVTGKQPT
jgi:hypothetical protein